MGKTRKAAVVEDGASFTSVQQQFMDSCRSDWVGTARSFRNKLERAETLARENTEAAQDFVYKVKNVLAAAVIPATNEKSKDRMKLACAWDIGPDGEEWRDDVLCPKSGVTWERESKFKAGGALHGCEQSYKAYQDFLQIITEDDQDGSRGWPFHMTGSGTRKRNSKEVYIRDDLEGGRAKYAFLASPSSQQEVPPSAEESKKALEARRREFMRRRGASAAANAGEGEAP